MTSLPASPNAPSRANVDFRTLRAADRALLEAILRATGVFSAEEIVVALELADDALNNPATTYQFLIATVENGRVAGYACWGATPLTEGVYDLYWIAVDPALHNRGIGAVLLHAVETRVRAAAGRLLVVETASKESYAPTRAFYLRQRYVEEARIHDFYKPGDDKVVYTKRWS